MKVVALAFAAVLAVGALPALAANADHPYANINRGNDRGNNTGDAQVPDLNQQQLDKVRAQNRTVYDTPVVGAPVTVAPVR